MKNFNFYYLSIAFFIIATYSFTFQTVETVFLGVLFTLGGILYTWVNYQDNKSRKNRLYQIEENFIIANRTIADLVKDKETLTLQKKVVMGIINTQDQIIKESYTSLKQYKEIINSNDEEIQRLRDLLQEYKEKEQLHNEQEQFLSRHFL